MIPDLAKIAALLAREFLFQSLSQEQLLALANKFVVQEFAAGATVSDTAHPIGKFFIIYDGQVQVETDHRRKERPLKILGPGDYFGDEKMLNGHGPDLFIKMLRPTTIISLDKEGFDELIQQYPDLKIILQTTLDSRRMASAPRFSWINPEEAVFIICRKHFLFLLRGLIFPLLLIIGSIPLITIGAVDASWLLILGVIILGIGLVGFIWNSLDWGNDYYIVTNQRVVWIEKILLLYDSRDEAPLYNVLAVDVFTSFFGRFFDYGDVSARTFTGRIPLKSTSRPYLLAAYIDGLRKRSEQLKRELEDQQIHEAVTQALQKRQAPTPADIIPNISAPLPFKPPKVKKSVDKPTGIGARWQNFLKVRYEQNGVITYRKAFPILVWKLWLPVLLLAIWTWGMVVLITQDDGGEQVFWFSLMIASLLGLLFWLWYSYTDWKNDIYRLTPTQIFDIEKKPLGSEVKKSADLENILTITHARNFIGVLLNFGQVIITVGETKFIFLDVHNPDRVHQDIANYQEALRQRKRMVEQARERERMVNWLVAYYAETNKK